MTAPRKHPPADPWPEMPADIGPIRLIAIDLDGTLLRSDKVLSPANASAIAEATNLGVHVVLASARPPRSVREVYHRLALDTLQVNYNGALIHDVPRGRHVFHQPLPIDLARRIVEAARQLDPSVGVSFEVLDKWYTDHVDDTLPTETSKRFDPDLIGPLDALLTDPVTKLMLLAPPEKLKPIHAMVRETFGDEIAILISDDYLIQLVHRQVDKASALKIVAERYNVPAHQVMAIGDADNDLGMIRWAGLGVAMGNAWERLKQSADLIAPANDDDGVAHVIQRYVLDRN